MNTARFKLIPRQASLAALAFAVLTTLATLGSIDTLAGGAVAVQLAQAATASIVRV